MTDSVSNPESENQGEEDLTPGRSLVFGVMEICMCVLKKQLPNLLPQSGASNQQPVLLVTIGTGFKSKFSFLKIRVQWFVSLDKHLAN